MIWSFVKEIASGNSEKYTDATHNLSSDAAGTASLAWSKS